VEGVVARIVEASRAAEPVAATIDDPSRAAALRVWALFGPLGTLAPGGLPGATSRAWFEELRLAPVVADSLRARGLDEAAAWWAAERVRLLVDLPLASTIGGPGAGLPARLVEAWLSHPVVRPFLRINAWDGIEWFHRESWDELVEWADLLERVQTPSSERVTTPVLRNVVGRALREAGAESGYRVDGLRAALQAPGGAGRADGTAAGATGLAHGEPRLPKATGLPPGPLHSASGTGEAAEPGRSPNTVEGEVRRVQGEAVREDEPRG